MGVQGGARAGWRAAGLFLLASAAAGGSSVALCAELGPQILYFEPVRIGVPGSSPHTIRKSARELTKLTLSAYGREYVFSVDANETFHDSFQQKPNRSSLKLYRGTIDGLPGSWVRFATKGLEVHGMFWDGQHLYVIAPREEVRDQLVPPLQATSDSVLFRLSDVVLPPGATACAATSDPTQPQRASELYASLAHEIKSSTMQQLAVTKVLEVSAIGDRRFAQRYADEQVARDEILLRLNNVDGIFSSQLGVQIRAATVHIYDRQNDPFSDSGHAPTLLEQLGNHRRRTGTLRAHGLTHLFTGRDLDGTTVGIAYMDSLCDARYGAGLTEVTTRGSWYESLIAAHEMGHNFGAVHDGEAGKACASTPSGQFLMSANVTGVDTFSECSLGLMRPSIARASCIAALPPADLALDADLGTLRHPVGASFDWELAVLNEGGSSALNARAEILIPPNVIIEDIFVVGGTCTSGAGVVQCHMGNIAGGASRRVQMTLRSDKVGSHSIFARVFADNDVDPDDNAGEAVLVVEPEADLALQASTIETVRAATEFDVQFTLSNAAIIDASGVTASFQLSAGLNAVKATLDEGACVREAALVTCTLQSLPAGASAAGTLTLRAAQSGAATIRGVVAGSYVDPNAANDEVTLSVQVSAAPASSPAQSSSRKSGGGSLETFMLVALALLGMLRRSFRA